MRAFLVQWDHFVAVHGRPSRVVSDRGSQLTSSDNTGKTNLLDWEEVVGREADRGTAWEFVPAGRQWRNKLAKSRVSMRQSSTCSPTAEWRDANPELQRALLGPGDSGQCGK